MWKVPQQQPKEEREGNNLPVPYPSFTGHLAGGNPYGERGKTAAAGI